MVRRLLAVGLAVAACGGAGGPRPDRPDAPSDLADESDLALRRAELDATPTDAAERHAMRATLAREYARRIDAELVADARPQARGHLLELLSLWRPTELGRPEVRAAAAPHRALFARCRAAFASAGDDLGAVAALAALAWLEPDDPGHPAELDEIFGYAQALARAQSGGLSRPIDLLSEVARAFPTRPVVDRLIGFLEDRRRKLSRAPVRPARTGDALRAHGLEGVAHTAYTIAGLLAWADRLADAPAALAPITGLGDDRELRARLTAALTARDLASLERLADWFGGGDRRPADHRASLAVAELALARPGDHARAHELAGRAAAELEQPLRAIRHYRQVPLARRTADAAAALAQLYHERIAELLQADRTRAALATLDGFDALLERAARVGVEVQPDRAAVWATVGRGLVHLGELDAGRRWSERSLEARPTQTALETLGLLDLKRGAPADAAARFAAAMGLRPADHDARYERAKLFRPLAEARAAAGDRKRAIATLEAGLDEWNKIAEDLELPPALAAESLVERGKLLIRLRARPTARAAFAAAVDVERGEGAILADVVAFLIAEDEPAAALDVYLTALAGRGIPETVKVYMSMWVVADALRREVAPPPLALDHLRGRRGALWSDDLARLATGRATFDALWPRATTRRRRAELCYYAAVLGDARRDPPRARRLLEQVLATDMVLDFEFELARRWLARTR